MNRLVRSLVSVAILCGCLLFSQWACAQQTPPSEQKESSPPPIEKELSFLLGKWEGKVRIYPNELLGNDQEVKGGGVIEYKLFGKVIEGSRSGKSIRGPLDDKEFILYNPASKAYDVIIINSEGFASHRTLSKVGDTWTTEYTGRRVKAGPPGEAGKAGGLEEIEFVIRGKYKTLSETELQYSSEINFGNSGFKPYNKMSMQRIP